MPCWEVTLWVLPDLEVLQAWLRAAQGLWHCAPLRWAGLETRLTEAALALGTVFVLSLSVPSWCVTDGSSQP